MLWTVRTGLWGVMMVCLGAQAWAEGAGSLEDHASGSVYLSYGLFVILGMIAVLLVYKGTRTK